MTGRPATITEVVSFAHGGAFARPLGPHIEKIIAACDPFSHGDKTLQFTDQHRMIVRCARFLLDPAENTAPSLDPSRPFGTPNPLGDIGDAAQVRTWEGVAQLYCEAQAAIPLFFAHANLSPGKYFITNLSMRELTWITDDPARSIEARLREMGIDSDRRFSFTPEHLALIRSVNWRWEGWSNAAFEENKIWPVVFVDAKRTYSVTQLQKNFDWEPDLDEHGYHQMTDAQRELVWKVHRELHPAFQVFAEHAELQAGSYLL